MNRQTPHKKKDQSYGKEKRVRKRTEYLAIQNGGEKVKSHHFLLATVINSNVDNSITPLELEDKDVSRELVTSEEKAPFRIGITVSKKVDKRAVRRNKLRRRVREYLRQRLPDIRVEGALVVIALKGACELPYDVIAKELNYLLKKAELIIPRQRSQ